ncbi:MAG: prenyltransferase [Planctomycetes bacterium]|nr:prenyltransferase [Planctomycetota bacterium]
MFGTLLKTGKVDCTAFYLGLAAVAATHLAANLINDYADAESGADWQDLEYYGFFGGSKLIQEEKLSPRFFSTMAIVFAVLSFVSVGLLAMHLRNYSILLVIIFVLTLSVSYSYGPLKMSYHGLGETVIFVLFGPAIVIGAAYIQDHSLFTLRTVFLSLPFGLLTSAILIANEVPDAFDDLKSGKKTLVGIVGPRKAYLLFDSLVASSYIIIIIAVAVDWLRPLSLYSLCAVIVAWQATVVLKKFYAYKYKLLRSSKLAIIHQIIVGLILILSVL